MCVTISLSKKELFPKVAPLLQNEFCCCTLTHKGAQVDAIMNEVLATKNIRAGACPSPEAVNTMRGIIKHWIDKDQPIAFLSPFGSEKPDGSSIDVAELCALKTLACLNNRVKRHYTPGITVNIRIEDASAPFLFYERAEEAEREANRYSGEFVNLVKVTGYTFIVPKRESAVVTSEQFSNKAEEIRPAMENYLRDISDEVRYAALVELGWNGRIQPETMSYYFGVFFRIYRGMTDHKAIHILARYLASALVRYKLGIVGNEAAWDGKFLELAFMGATPGIDKSRMLRRVHYRTLPQHISSNHCPPWRAKGHIDLMGGRFRLTTFNDPQRFHPLEVELSDFGHTATIRADYVAG